jgi:hypothetical protein
MSAIRPLSEPLPPDLALDEAPFDVKAFEQLPDPVDDTPADAEIRERAERWRIQDDDGAEWSMRHLVVYQQAVDDLARQRDDWMQRIDAWFSQASRGPLRSVEHFEALLSDYMRRLRLADEDVKSRPLPSGRLTSTGTGGKAAVADNDAVVAWIEENLVGEYDELVKDEPTVRIGELRKRVSVEKRQIGMEIDATLLCGHQIVEVWRFEDHTGEEWSHPPASMLCEECPEDLVDGTQPIVKVSVVGTAPAFEHVVIDAEGNQVPGLVVEPAGFNVTVKPDLS